MSNVAEKGRVCNRCGHFKLYSEYYKRSGLPKGFTPTLPGHVLSECKQCMKERAVSQQRLAPWDSRVESEKIAIEILMDHGIMATTGKAASVPDVDLVAFGSVWIEVKHARADHRGRKTEFKFNTTPKQRERGMLAHVVMLICEYPDRRRTFHLFESDFPAFYHENGDLKSAIVYRVNKRKPDNRGPWGSTQILQQDMDSARDNYQLVWDYIQRVHKALLDGQRPESYTEPFRVSLK